LRQMWTLDNGNLRSPYFARPTSQPINAPGPAPHHDPTIAAPPAPMGKQPSLHEAAPQAAPTLAPTMRPNHTGADISQALYTELFARTIK
jgi:hypothetical protein